MNVQERLLQFLDYKGKTIERDFERYKHLKNWQNKNFHKNIK